jgi:hypothetical protein
LLIPLPDVIHSRPTLFIPSRDRKGVDQIC